MVVIEPSGLGHVFEVGDMVWAKMKSLPWWPGYVYSEEVATPLVRQSKREGLILVAFFGASRYGWIDSSQLLPFDSNYAEMSQQTNSRQFLKAVEQAIGELSRRSDLALSCMCHNKQTIRKIDMQGFISVDADGYDPKAVYSIDAIGKARNAFQPQLAVAFLRQLALEPTGGEHFDVDVGFIQKKATVMSYRKAVYGYNPVHSSNQESDLQEAPSKAPLGGGNESKEIKRENENVTSSEDPTIATFESESKVSSTHDENGIVEESEDTQDDFRTIADFRTEVKRPKRTAGELGFGKSVTSWNKKKQKKEGIGIPLGSAKKTGQPPSSHDKYETEISRLLDDLRALAVDSFNGVDRGSRIKRKKELLKFRSVVFQKGQNFSRIVQKSDRKVTTQDNFPSSEPHKMVGSQTMVSGPENVGELEGSKDEFPSPAPPPKTVCSQTEVSGPERLIGELEGGTKVIPHDDFPSPGPHNIAEVSGPALVERTIGEVDKKLVGFQTEVSDPDEKQGIYFSAQKPETSYGGMYEEPGLSQVLDDLYSLAVDPFNTTTTNVDRGSKGREAFLRFRSSVFQKGKNFSLPPAGGEPDASKSSKECVEPPPVVNPEGGLKQNASVQLPPVPVVKLEGGLKQNASVQLPPVPVVVKPEGGLKRGASVRQEEMAAAKKKKVGDIGNLIKEKKTTKMIDVLPGSAQAPVPARDVKQVAASAIKRTGPEFIKKTQEGATMLMMKFPRGGSLPSFNELKARFVRYGPMDHSATRIFWNTFSCQVVFRHKAHAEAAYRFVVGSTSVFGNTGVRCILKEIGVVGLAEPEPPVKVLKEEDKEDRRPSSTVPVTAKTILKKSSSEEVAAAAGSGGRERLKFSSDSSKNAVSSSVVTSSSSTTPSLPPSPPLPPHYGTALLAPLSSPPRSMQTQTAPLRVINRPIDGIAPPLMAPNRDIGQQMLSLLTRCKDVVAHVSGVLGYTPYHPL